LRRPLRSADRFKDRAMLRGSSFEKTPGSKSSALLVSVTFWDQRFFCLGCLVDERTADCLRNDIGIAVFT
jgi:hypothetical protein